MIQINTINILLVLLSNLLLLFILFVVYQSLYSFGLNTFFSSFWISIKIFLIAYVPTLSVVFLCYKQKANLLHSKVKCIAFSNLLLSGMFLGLWMILFDVFSLVFLLLSILTFFLSPYILVLLNVKNSNKHNLLDNW